MTSLNDGEAVTDACVGTTEEGELVGPHTRNLRRLLARLAPALRPTDGDAVR